MHSVKLEIKYALDVLWRRRWLLITPILIMIPASFLFAQYGPKTYIAKAILVLQESGGNNPLLRSDRSDGDRMNERFDGFRALAGSDKVLRAVMKDVLGSKAPTNEMQIAEWTADFGKSITIDLRGNDVVELSVKGSNPTGMGFQVRSLTVRLLDALLAEQNATSGVKLLMDRYKDEVTRAEEALAKFQNATTDKLTPEQRAEVDALRIQLKERTDALKKAETDAATARNLTNTDPKDVADEITNLSTSLSKVDAAASQAPETLAANNRLALLKQQQEAENWKTALMAETEKLKSRLKELSVDPASDGQQEQHLATLALAVQSARAQYDDYERRYRSAVNSTLGVLSAPERIRIVDLPEDPKVPVTTAVKYALVGMLAGLIMAVGLVVGAEIMDPTVRKYSEFEDIIGAPVVATLK